MTNKSSKKNRSLIIAYAAILCLISVVVGAFAAHALSAILSQEKLESIKTASRYSLIHGTFIIALGSIHWLSESSYKKIAWICLIGTTLFSFSIYTLVYLKYHSIETSIFIPLITPFGGSLIIISWGLLAYQSIKKYVKD